MKILIVGYYGFKNIGDEAILEVLINRFREYFYYPRIYISSISPLETSRRYNVLSVNRKKFSSVVNCIKETDVLVLGGGSLLQDITGRGWTALYYLLLIFYAKRYNKKVFFLSQGVGPLKKKISRYLAKVLLRKVDFISVRESESRRYLQKLGIKQKIKLIPDPALLLENKLSISKEKKCIGISLRKSFFKDKARLAQHLDQIILNLKVNILFFSFQQGVDDILIEKVRAMMKYAGETQVFGSGKTPKEVCEKIGECRVFAGARLHSLIFAAMNNTPFLGFNYDPKVAAFCKILGMTWLEEFETEFLVESFRNLIQHEEYLTKLVKLRMVNLSKMSELGLEQCCELMTANAE